jgi:transposase-like protein
MMTDRPFAELNLWQRIFAEHWEGFVAAYQAEHQRSVPSHWQQNVRRMLACGDIREGYHEYLCEHCHQTRKVGFTCKSRLCLRCFKGAVDGWLETAQRVLFEGVVHRQIVLTVPPPVRALVLAGPKFLKVFVDAGARAVQQLVMQWRRKKKIRVGIMAVLQVHGRAGNPNPHVHLVVSEGGVDNNGRWQPVTYFDTRKLRKLWQYEVLSALKRAVKGTRFGKGWPAKLGRMFRQYPAGFDCHAMPEKAPVERLVIYLCKYVSSPPISIRRIEDYDGRQVTFRYEDHRRGRVRETLSAPAFIGRMIQHLPAKNFRMVRYYGIYARPVRAKVHAQVAEVLAGLQESQQQRAGERSQADRTLSAGMPPREGPESFSDRAVRCPQCGREMTLVRIWDKRRGVIYDLFEEAGRRGSSAPPAETVAAGGLSGARQPAQMLFAFAGAFAAESARPSLLTLAAGPP